MDGTDVQLGRFLSIPKDKMSTCSCPLFMYSACSHKILYTMKKLYKKIAFILSGGIWAERIDCSTEQLIKKITTVARDIIATKKQLFYAGIAETKKEKARGDFLLYTWEEGNRKTFLKTFPDGSWLIQTRLKNNDSLEEVLVFSRDFNAMQESGTKPAQMTYNLGSQKKHRLTAKKYVGNSSIHSNVLRCYDVGPLAGYEKGAVPFSVNQALIIVLEIMQRPME
jgi:hypothetical protein